MNKPAFLLLLLSASVACAEMPLLKPTKVVKESIGGDYTSAMVVEAGGKKVFIKSLRSKPYNDGGRMLTLTRWGNFESDILAKELFSLVDVQCPASRVVKLPPEHVAARNLGNPVVAMEFVDESFARGGKVQEGFWPGSDRADMDAFINMALVDVLMGNADRRDPNYFVALLPNGMVRPIPIDNNSGFTTFLVWTRTSNLINFFPSYSGLGQGWPWEMLGTIGNVVVRGNETHHVHEKILNDPRHRSKVLAAAKALAAKLTDAEIDRMVALIPSEIIPSEVRVQFTPELARDLTGNRAKFGVDPSKTLQGAELFKMRIDEIKSTLKWRRSNLVAGITEYFKRQGGAIDGQQPPPVVRPPVVKPPPVIAQPPVLKPRPRPTLGPWPPRAERDPLKPQPLPQPLPQPIVSPPADWQPWMPFPADPGARKDPSYRKDVF